MRKSGNRGHYTWRTWGDRAALTKKEAVLCEAFARLGSQSLVAKELGMNTRSIHCRFAIIREKMFVETTDQLLQALRTKPAA